MLDDAGVFLGFRVIADPNQEHILAFGQEKGTLVPIDLPVRKAEKAGLIHEIIGAGKLEVFLVIRVQKISHFHHPFSFDAAGKRFTLPGKEKADLLGAAEAVSPLICRCVYDSAALPEIWRR